MPKRELPVSLTIPNVVRLALRVSPKASVFPPAGRELPANEAHAGNGAEAASLETNWCLMRPKVSVTDSAVIITLVVPYENNWTVDFRPLSNTLGIELTVDRPGGSTRKLRRAIPLPVPILANNVDAHQNEKQLTVSLTRAAISDAPSSPEPFALWSLDERRRPAAGQQTPKLMIEAGP